MIAEAYLNVMVRMPSFVRVDSGKDWQAVCLDGLLTYRLVHVGEETRGGKADIRPGLLATVHLGVEPYTVDLYQATINGQVLSDDATDAGMARIKCERHYERLIEGAVKIETWRGDE